MIRTYHVIYLKVVLSILCMLCDQLYFVVVGDERTKVLCTKLLCMSRCIPSRSEGCKHGVYAAVRELARINSLLQKQKILCSILGRGKNSGHPQYKQDWDFVWHYGTLGLGKVKVIAGVTIQSWYCQPWNGTVEGVTHDKLCADTGGLWLIKVTRLLYVHVCVLSSIIINKSFYYFTFYVPDIISFILLIPRHSRHCISRLSHWSFSRIQLFYSHVQSQLF